MGFFIEDVTVNSKVKPIDVAAGFGRALDHDEFDVARGLIDPACVYTIGDATFSGPDEITGSYEKNMIEGRKMLDELIWGESYVEEVTPNEFLIHFTDHIKHKGQSFIHRCKQKITIGESTRIVRIEHIDDPTESSRLKKFYEQVGI